MGWLRALNTKRNLCGVGMTNPLDNQGQSSSLGSSRCRAPLRNFFLRDWNNQRNSKIYSCFKTWVLQICFILLWTRLIRYWQFWQELLGTSHWNFPFPDFPFIWLSLFNASPWWIFCCIMGWLRALNTKRNLCGVGMTNPLDNQGQSSSLGSSRCRAPLRNFFLRDWNNQRNSKIYSCFNLSSTNLFHIAWDNTHQLLTV